MRFYKLGDLLVPESIVGYNRNDLVQLENKLAVEWKKQLSKGDADVTKSVSMYLRMVEAEINYLDEFAHVKQSNNTNNSKESNMQVFFSCLMIVVFVLLCIMA